MTDVFQEVRDRVTSLDVARHYGLEVNRAGFCCCPFHHEKTASMKLYPGAKGFYCFGCHTGGSVVDLTAQLFGLDAIGAVQKINDDFGLDLPLDRKPTQKEKQVARHRMEVAEAHRAFEEWRKGFIVQLNACFRVAHLALKSLETPADLDRLTASQVLAIRDQAYFEWASDVLTGGTMAEQMEIFRERRWIEQQCNQILNSTQTKSGAA
ncbi:MAG: CHC2 zinc finger domain-containing protein [Faecousia sp.]